METYARQVILPPPPSIWWALWASLCALVARVRTSLQSQIERLVRRVSSPPGALSRAPITAADDAVTDLYPDLEANLASLRAQGGRPVSGYRRTAPLRESAATAVEIRRAG